MPNLLIVTDQEHAITQFIRDVFPGLQHFLCWNHILQDCKRCLHQRGAQSQLEVQFYVDSIRQLLSSDNENAYKDSLIQCTTKWRKPFTDHYMATVHVAIDQLGTWRLRLLGLDSITANPAEAFNS